MAFVKARSGGFGMDAELAAKRSANFDTARAAVAITWLCELSKTSRFPVEQMWARLKDGHILCSAANRLQANACPKVNSSSMPFKQMENVTAFINACRSIFRVPEHELFETVDLFEEKDLESFVTCICALGRVIAAAPPRGFKGPYIGNAPLPGQVAEQPVKYFDTPSPVPSISRPQSAAVVSRPAAAPAPAPHPAESRCYARDFSSSKPPPAPSSSQISPRAPATAIAAAAPASFRHDNTPFRPIAHPDASRAFLFEGTLGKSKGTGMVGMMGYQERYFTLDASSLRWFDEKSVQKGRIDVWRIEGFELIPGVVKGKFGMELRGINVNKGSDAKSYFLWAPSRSIIEDLCLKLQSVVVSTSKNTTVPRVYSAESPAADRAPRRNSLTPAPAPAFAFASRVPVSALNKSKSSQQPSGGRDICTRCRKPVYHAECMQGPGGLKWHKICFRCTSCSKQVDSLTSCVTTDDVLMCKTCYSKQRGPVGYGYGGALASETQGKA